jgi:hypothetical protein
VTQDTALLLYGVPYFNGLNFVLSAEKIPPTNSLTMLAYKKSPIGRVMETSYSSKPVKIPFDFLKAPAYDAKPTTIERIDFASTELPEYAGMYAAVLDNVLSASECAELLRLAESATTGWQQALINAGLGLEALRPEIRHCERMIWDDREMVKRIWDRCILADGLENDLRILEKGEIIGKRAARLGEKWRMTRLNERMRFLKYGPGQYFRSKIIFISIECPVELTNLR